MRKLYGDWRDFFYCFDVAFLSPRKLMLALCGMVMSMLGGYCISLGLVARLGIRNITGREILFSFKQAFLGRDVDEFLYLGNLILALLRELTDIFGCCGGLAVYGLFIFPWLWLVWCHYGGIISRIAAIDIARNTSADTLDCTRFVGRKFASLFWPPLSLVLLVALFLTLAFGMGLATRIPVAGDVFKIIGGLLFPLQLLLVMAAGVLGLGLAFGISLMIPTISVEGTDALDAITRSFSYSLRAPLRFLWNFGVMALFCVVSTAAVIALACLFFHISLWALEISLPAPTFAQLSAVLQRPYAASAIEQAGSADLIFAWAALIWYTFLGLTFAAYPFSYLFTATTMLYMIQRKSIDGIGYDRVFLAQAAPPPVAAKLEPPKDQPRQNPFPVAPED